MVAFIDAHRAALGVEPSVGSVGDSYDNALAESVIGLYKTEVIRLFYDYGEDAVERRAPHREAHLKLATESVGRGDLPMGGAFADPVDGAVLLFRVEDPSVVEEFVRRDPYVASGLVTGWRIRPWTVVVEAKIER